MKKVVLLKQPFNLGQPFQTYIRITSLKNLTLNNLKL